MNNSTSLVVPKKGIFRKIQEFFRKIFKHKSEQPEEEAIQQPKIEEKNKENFIYDLKKNANSDIKELINKIQNGEVNLEEKDEAELNEIEKRLNEYLAFLEAAVIEKREEIKKAEQMINVTVVNE